MKTKILYIKGMHCMSCETLLQSEFSQVPHVIKAHVSQTDNIARIDYENELDVKRLRQIAARYGYEASEDNWQSTDEKTSTATISQWIYSLVIVALLATGYTVLLRTGVMDGIAANNNNITGIAAFFIGIAASLSTCLMVVGAVVISFGQQYRSKSPGMKHAVIKPNILFHAGRLTSFFLLGGLLGLIGGQISLSGNAIAIITIALALVLLWLGLHSLGFLPPLSRLGLHVPKSLASGAWTKYTGSSHTAAPLILGMMSFFLPCGFTQSMQLWALASGGFWQGGTMLLLFALGTTPVLLIIGISSSIIKSRSSLVFQKAVGMIIILFAFYTFHSGWALIGVTSNVLSSTKTQTTQPTKTDQTAHVQKNEDTEFQTVTMSVTSRGFEPKTIQLKKNMPVKWIINGESVSGCTDTIIVPSLNISQKLTKGLNVVEFTPKAEGKIAFSCWMGMVRGEFVVN